MSHMKWNKVSRAPLQSPWGCFCASPQSGDSLSNAVHHCVSSHRKDAHFTRHLVVRQVAREQSVARTIYLPELTQASRCGTAETRLARVTQAACIATDGFRTCQRASDIRRAPASPSPPFIEHVDVALLPLPLRLLKISHIARVMRGERPRTLLANHSLQSVKALAAANFAETATAALETSTVSLLQWRCR